MKENIEITNGLLFSGRILITLVEREGISREEAYTIAQSNAMRCWNEKTPLLELLKNDPRIKKTSESELESLFDLEYYLKHIEEVFSRFPELTENSTIK
jgi:adenylosuccinate lyase